MWGKLLKCKWGPDLTLTPKSLPKSGRLCLPHLSAKWNLCKHILPLDRYRLPRNTIRLHWDEGWQFWGLSTHDKILWKRRWFARFHADHSKPLENQVKEKPFVSKDFLQIVNSYSSDSSPTTLQVALDFSLHMYQQTCSTGPWEWVLVEAVSAHQKASSPHHPTLTTTRTMQIASTPSHSPLALSSCWIFSAWICKCAHPAGVIHVTKIM